MPGAIGSRVLRSGSSKNLLLHPRAGKTMRGRATVICKGYGPPMHPTERFGLMIWPFARDSRSAPRPTLPGEPGAASSSAADALLGGGATLPDPFLVLDSEGIVILANRHAREALDTDPAGEHISATIRARVILDAVVQVVASGEAVRTDYERRSPLERRFEAFIAPIARPGQDDRPRGTPAVLTLPRDVKRH